MTAQFPDSRLLRAAIRLLDLKAHAAKDSDSALPIRVRVNHNDAVFVDAVQRPVLMTGNTGFLKLQQAFPDIIIDQMTVARQ
jgi:hypothetical protein